jgi:tryptophan synthase beta chain
MRMERSTPITWRNECVSLGLDKKILLTEDKIPKKWYCILPDHISGCVGGGSSFTGLFDPFYYDKINGRAPKDVEFTAVESTACPRMSAGKYMYDYGDTGRIIPLVLMHPLGHNFVPEPSYAIKKTIDEAIRCKETGEEKTLLFLLHGHFDMKAYDDYITGNLQPYEMPKAKIQASLSHLRAMYPSINR